MIPSIREKSENIIIISGEDYSLLLTGKDMVPKVVEKYIKPIKPMIPKDMPKPPFMHGFILGKTENISYDGQVQIENILSIDHEMMEHEKDNHKMMEMDNKMMGMDHEMMKMNHMDEDKFMDMKHEMMEVEDFEYMHMLVEFY